MMTVFALFTSLLLCHFLADYCLTTPQMIGAKATGKHLRHIVLHAAVHAVLMSGVLLVFEVTFTIVACLFALELVSHFAIDYGKGLFSRKFPAFGDNTKKAFWVLYGFDQLLHLLVIEVMVYCAL